MAKQYKKQKPLHGQHHATKAQNRSTKEKVVRQSLNTTDEYTMPETNDAGDAISEASLYDASGAATGGGVDTPMAVEESTEAEIRKHPHIHQGNSAYAGGGADNGSNL